MNSIAIDRVDPELRALLDIVPTVDFSDALLGAIRQRPLLWPADETLCDYVDVSTVSVAGILGGPDVSVRISRPKNHSETLPCILHIHGGGFVAGSVEASAPKCDNLARQLDCMVVSVDYRLAPETRFPGALEDCFAVLLWLQAEAERLGLDPMRIGVMGESAGGGLAAALVLLARDQGGPALAFQHLIYPMLDDRTCDQPVSDPAVGAFIWTPTSNRYGWSSLLGEAPGGDDISPYAAPARETNLTGLPPTFIAVGDLDLFAEEDTAYARRLSRAGVDVELHVYPGCYHGFDLAPDAQISATARADSQKALASKLHPSR
jgi:acetyl esterase/lipase